MMLDQLLQAWIVLTGSISIYLLTDKSEYRKMGCWIGLAGQPAWFFATHQNFQWGMFLMAVVFTGAYVRGIVRKPRE